MENQIICIANMLNRALNTLNYRLMDHCNKVAYLVLKMSQKENTFTQRELTQHAYLGMLHDIGAYQTENLDSLDDSPTAFNYEIKDPLAHSVYSYLFLNEYDFFHEQVDAVFFHHFYYERLMKTQCKNKDLAAKLFIADKIDFLITKNLALTLEDIYKFLDNPTFSKKYVAIIKQAEEEEQVLSKILNNTFKPELLTFLREHNKEEGLRTCLVHMLPRIIDFRSKDTVTHTVATVEIAVILAKLFNFSAEEINDVYYGALLHDIGKISTSLLVLEKPDRLSPLEYEIMKDHILMSEYILKGCVSEKVFNIAVRHHEKIDGTGYPHNLKYEDLSLAERMLAVADLMSALLGRRAYKDPFPKEKVISILQSAIDEQKMCSEVITKALENFDYIAESVEKCSKLSMQRYEKLTQEAEELYNKYKEI